MKRQLMISLSLNHSPVQSPRRLMSPVSETRNPFCMSAREVSNSRVNEVVDQCVSLRESLTTNYKGLKARLNTSLSQLHQVRKDLYTTAPRGWKDSPKYLQGKARIKHAEQEEQDRKMDEQVSLLRRMVSGSDSPSKSVKLTLLKTQLKGKKVRNVRESLFLPMRMLDKFSIARQLGKSQRQFGSIAPLEPDGIFTFLQDEIAKYEKERINRILAANPSLHRGVRSSLANLLNRRNFTTSPSSETSPLQSYLKQFQQRRMMGESLSTRRRKEIEVKMSAIQPSPEIRSMSQKYLPKFMRKGNIRKKTVSPRAAFVVTEKSVNSSVTSSTETLSHDQSYIVGEIQKELTNIGSLLRIATMVKEKNRKELIRKKK